MSMVLNLKEVQNVDDRTKMIVKGFIKQCQILFPQNVPYYNIPTLVNHLCLLFYWQREFFQIFNGKRVELSEDKMEVRTFDNDSDTRWNTLYGNIVFDNESHPNTIIEYEMDINISASNGALGIASSGKEQEDTNSLIWNDVVLPYSKHIAAYALHGSSLYYIGDGRVKPRDRYVGYKVRDRIRMTINIAQSSLTFWSITQNKELGGYLDIDFSMKYRFAISITNAQSVKLLNVKLS